MKCSFIGFYGGSKMFHFLFYFFFFVFLFLSFLSSRKYSNLWDNLGKSQSRGTQTHLCLVNDSLMSVSSQATHLCVKKGDFNLPEHGLGAANHAWKSVPNPSRSKGLVLEAGKGPQHRASRTWGLEEPLAPLPWDPAGNQPVRKEGAVTLASLQGAVVPMGSCNVLAGLPSQSFPTLSFAFHHVLSVSGWKQEPVPGWSIPMFPHPMTSMSHSPRPVATGYLQ